MIRSGLLKSIAVGLVLLPLGAMAQGDFSSVEIKSETVVDGVFMLTGAGGNIGVSVGDDGVFIIDDQFAPLTDKILAKISELSDQPVRFVINTHWHGDHSGGNENLAKGGTIVVAHDNVYKRMSTDQFMAFFNNKVPASPRDALPVVTFNDRSTLRLNGDHVHAIHVAHAHTDGDAIVHFEKANVIHMGDTFFHGLYPFIDVDSGGGINGVIAAADKGLSLADENTKIIPGHGPLTDRAGLMGYRDMLVEIRDNVKALKDAGKSLEEAIAATPGKKYDEKLGGAFIKPDALVTFMYRSL